MPAGSGPDGGTPVDGSRRRWGRALRRSVPFLTVGAVLLLAAIPALFDLRRLFVGLGLVMIGLGVVRALLNAFDDRPHAGVR